MAIPTGEGSSPRQAPSASTCLSTGFASISRILLIFAEGKGVPVREKELAEVMKQPEIRLRLALGMGSRSWTVCASDLTFEYVKINAHYHT